jgi:hypothetical protein
VSPLLKKIARRGFWLKAVSKDQLQRMPAVVSLEHAHILWQRRFTDSEMQSKWIAKLNPKVIIMAIKLNERIGGKVLEVEVTGKLVHQDYQHFVPEFERLVKEHGRIRVLFEMADVHGWNHSSYRAINQGGRPG